MQWKDDDDFQGLDLRGRFEKGCVLFQLEIEFRHGEVGDWPNFLAHRCEVPPPSATFARPD